MAATIVGLAVAGGLLCGWLILLVIGVVHLRRGKPSVGLPLTVIGGLWGLLVIGGALLTYHQVTTYDAEHTPVPFVASSHQGPLGTVSTLDHFTCSVTMLPAGAKKPYSFVSHNGTFQAPAGTYEVRSWSCSSTAPHGGTTWALSASSPERLKGFVVIANATTPLPLGPPLTARIKPGTVRGGKVAFALELQDAAGNDYTLHAYGKQVLRPGFEAVDAAGKVVWSGKFEYG